MSTLLSSAGRPKAVLRYHGGKTSLVKWITAHFPAHERYVEPFGGGAGVLFHKRPAPSEVYNDLNGDVVNFFRVLRDRTAELCRVVSLTPYARAEFEDAFDRDGDDVERARRLLVRATMGYAGESATGTDAGQAGFRSWNRPDKRLPDEWQGMPAHLAAAALRLKHVTIENRDALGLMADNDSPATLTYCDPPYVHETRNSVRHAYACEMTDEDHRAFAAVARGMVGPVIVSGYDCDLYRDLFAGWQIVRKATTGNGHRGITGRVETLWLSPACSAALPSPDLFSAAA